DLISQPLLCPSVGTNARSQIDAVFARAGGASLQPIVDSHNSALLLTYVEQGLGIALTSLSPILMREFESRLAFREVSHLFESEEVILAQRERRYAAPHVDDFVRLVEACSKT
ncbi:MAG TPA: LysR substrate-binding domain-containing protein, partial [Planctomycetota bacterium]|nr:LysR substrate-binding domain-containing protein [Planctomycetota bacterium]